MFKKLLKHLLFRKYKKLIEETKSTQTPITYKILWNQKILGINKQVPWPVHPTSIITGHQNICIGIDTNPGYMPGCYIQGIGTIEIGDYTQVSANVGLITSNHDLYDTRNHHKGFIKIGKYGLIGMNSVILPNVELGDFVIVGAGSVVTKSFKEGYCVLAGNPARIIKHLDQSKSQRFKNKFLYKGYRKLSNQ